MPDYNSLARTLADSFRVRDERRRQAFQEEDILARRAREDQEYAYTTGRRAKEDQAYEALAASVEQQPAPSMLQAAASPEPQMRSPFQPPRALVQKPQGYSYPPGIKGPRSALKTPERLDATADAIAQAYGAHVTDPRLAALIRADRSAGAKLYADIIQDQQLAPRRIYEATQAADKERYSRERDTIGDKRDERKYAAERGDVSYNRTRQDRLDKEAKVRAEAEESRKAAGFETPGQKRFGDTASTLATEGGKRLLGMLFPSAGENIAATNAGARRSEGAANRTSREKIAGMKNAVDTARMELDRLKANARTQADYDLQAQRIRNNAITSLMKSGDLEADEAARHYGMNVEEGTFSNTITIPPGGSMQPPLIPPRGAGAPAAPSSPAAAPKSAKARLLADIAALRAKAEAK